MTGIIARLERSSAPLELDAADLARALDTNTKTVQRWFRHSVSPRRRLHERILETVVVLNRLRDVLVDDSARDWLLTPVPMLDYEKPIDLLQSGEYRKVLDVIDGIDEGVFL